jgi:hypothetical protein
MAPRYFAKAKLGETFYGQPSGSTSGAPIVEFEIIGMSDDFVTAARIAQSKNELRYPKSLHVFSRHTGESRCGWAHVSTFSRRVNPFWPSPLGWAYISLLTILGLCVLLGKL